MRPAILLVRLPAQRKSLVPASACHENIRNLNYKNINLRQKIPSDLYQHFFSLSSSHTDKKEN
jgi:hypothetical protein